MAEQCTVDAGQDPLVPDWHNLVLPDAWPDGLSFSKPADLWCLLSQVFGSARMPVELPEEMPGREGIPKYILQEFHNIPNGNYSKNITRGYITGFERLMMGSMERVRNRNAELMGGFHSVLDVGCAGGRMGEALRQAGVADVWGIDPSPYLLQHAARAYPEVHFVQGIAEQTGFPSERFEGITACFLLHELPPRYLDQALQEFFRILKPGGLLAISEPSPQQIRGSLISLFKNWGFAGLYFRVLARFVYEPFLDGWHNQNMETKLAEFGFELLEDHDEVPIRRLLARKTIGHFNA